MKLQDLILFSSFLISSSSCSSNYEKIKSESELHQVYISEDKNLLYKPYPQSEIDRVLCIAEKDYSSVVRELKTPFEAGIYCTKFLKHGGDNADFIIYGKENYWASFKIIHKNKVDDCDGGAVAAAAILSDDWFPPYILVMSDKEKGHAVFLYQNQKGKYGSIGINNEDINPPIIDSLEELVRKIGKNIGMKDDINYEVYDLGSLHPDFIDNDLDNCPE